MEQQKNINVGMVGHSFLRRYPLNQFPNNFNISLQIQESHIKDFHGKASYREFINHSPKLHAVVFIIGGNDIDDEDSTDEHIRDISYSFMNSAIFLNQANIRTFFVPIHPRSRPGCTTVENYHMLADKMSLAVGVYMERTFGYSAMIRDDTTDRKFIDDGIHITPEAYLSLTQNITQHVFEHIHTPARAQQPLAYNWEFLNQERTYRQGRDINSSTLSSRITSNTTNHTDRATSSSSSSSTQKLDTDRENTVNQ